MTPWPCDQNLPPPFCFFIITAESCKIREYTASLVQLSHRYRTVFAFSKSSAENQVSCSLILCAKSFVQQVAIFSKCLDAVLKVVEQQAGNNPLSYSTTGND
ncbi:hypothetical protein ATANTOWER_004630 [Ataeniobius toweri]|uniref:Uncharacterized protein n=1 Tax=Ataeniobius toweri TaxID=208326 RepID=A0ABU7BML8_9TELE|nr:hypothetical protein [Ataeniobius toweri]